MYKKAIEYLMAEDIDFKAVCIEVAKSNPSVFVKAFEKVDGKIDEVIWHAHKGLYLPIENFTIMFEKWGRVEWFEEVMSFLFSDPGGGQEKIRAIKVHRNASGYGLRESKEFIESLIEMAGVKEISVYDANRVW